MVDWVNIDMLYTQLKGQVRQEKNSHTHSSCWLTAAAAAAAKINNTEGALEITEKREFSLSLSLFLLLLNLFSCLRLVCVSRIKGKKTITKSTRDFLSVCESC